jgi:isopenicillin N synthase-like dioxygenase
MTAGFFYITNFGLTEKEVNRQFAIARDFYTLPYSEKIKYRGPMEQDGKVPYQFSKRNI